MVVLGEGGVRAGLHDVATCMPSAAARPRVRTCVREPRSKVAQPRLGCSQSRCAARARSFVRLGGSPLFFVFFVFFVRGTSVLRGPDVGLECQIVARSKASMKACLGALLRGLGEEHLSVRASRGASVRRRFAGVGARSRAAEEPPRR